MKKKKILFDATILADGYFNNSKRSGLYVVTANILKQFLKSKDLELTLYCAPMVLKRLKTVLADDFSDYQVSIINRDHISYTELMHIKVIEAAKTNFLKNKLLSIANIILKTFNVLQRNYYAPKNIIKQLNEFDGFFSPAYHAPKFIRNSNLKRYTIIYDLIPVLFANYYPITRIFGYSWVKSVLKTLDYDDYCFSISEHTKQDFIKYSKKLDPDKITVTALAASKNFYHCNNQKLIDLTKEKYHIPKSKKYIFSLCTLEPRKNLIFAAKAFINWVEKEQISDLVLVLAGSEHECFVKKLEQEFQGSINFEEYIVKTGYIDDKDLSPLYSAAEFFIFPSLYEGFGLPLLEAMQCGSAVIASNSSSMPEVVGDAGLYINPKSEPELIADMNKLYHNPALKNKYAELGLKRAQQFSWQNCATIMLNKLLND